MFGGFLRALDLLVFDKVERRLRRDHKRIYRAFEKHYGYCPRIAAPTNTSELIQWRKVFDHNPLFAIFADKLATKKWAASKDPRVKTAPVLWVGKNPSEIPLGLLDSSVIVKANHGSTFNYAPIGDGRPFEFHEIVAKANSWMKADYWKWYDEWAYSRVERFCFVERRVAPSRDILELEFRCHNGTCSTAIVMLNEKTPAKLRADLYPDGSMIRSPETTLPPSFPLPGKYLEVRRLAEKLSEGIDFVRVDFILSGDDYFLCEMTVYPRAGYGVEDEAARLIFSAWVKAIDQSWFLSQKPDSFLSWLYRGAVVRHFRRMANKPVPAS